MLFMSLSEITNFAVRHWPLSVAFIAILLAIAVEELKAKKGKQNHLPPGDAIRLINHENAVLIDIRSEEKFKNGHIVKAINIPVTTKDYALIVKQLQKYQKKPIILCAEMTQQTHSLEKALQKENFNIYLLANGIQAWTKAELPLTQK